MVSSAPLTQPVRNRLGEGWCRIRGAADERRLPLGSNGEDLARRGASDAFGRYGLELVEVAPAPVLARLSDGRTVRSVSLAPLSTSEWVINGALGGALLAYLTGLAFALRWVLRWLFGS